MSHKRIHEHAAAGDRVFEALTPAERDHLSQALSAASKSLDDDDCLDDWLCALGNADVSPPNEAGEPVTEAHQRRICAELERARLSEQTDTMDWWRLLSGAFGRGSYERLVGLYGDALVRFEE